MSKNLNTGFIIIFLIFLTVQVVYSKPPPVSHEQLSRQTAPAEIAYTTETPTKQDTWQDAVNPNRHVDPNRHVICYAVFNPYLGGLKREIAVDSIREDYQAYISDKSTKPLYPSKSNFKEVFDADLSVNLEKEKYISIPSVSPDAQILEYSISPSVNLGFHKDGADNYYVKSDAVAKTKVRVKMGTDGDYFRLDIPNHLTLDDVPKEILKEPPENVKSKARIIIEQLGLKDERNLRVIVNTLTNYFSGFGCGTIPSESIEPDIYLAIAKYKQGACGERSFAFFITANSIGLPTRMVSNECHAFVEIFIPARGWQRIDLGGCGTSELRNTEGKHPHLSLLEEKKSEDSGAEGFTYRNLSKKDITLYLTIAPSYAIRGETTVDVNVEVESEGTFIDGLKVLIKDATDNRNLGIARSGASRLGKETIQPVLLWKKEWRKEVEDEQISGVAITKDGGYIAVSALSKVGITGGATTHGSVYLLGVTGEVRSRFSTGDTSDIRHISASSLGEYIIVESFPDFYLFGKYGSLIWKLSTGDITSDVDISSDGRLIVAASGDSVYLFNDKEILWKYDTKSFVSAVSITSDGSRIVAGTFKGDVYAFDNSGKVISTYKISESVKAVSISPEGNYAGVASPHTIYFMDRDNNLLWEYKTKLIGSLSLSSNGDYLAAGSEDVVYLLDKKGNLIWEYPAYSKVVGVDISSDAKYIAGAWSGSVNLFDTKITKEESLIPSIEIVRPNVSIGNHTIIAEFRGNDIYNANTAYSEIFIASRTNLTLKSDSKSYGLGDAIRLSGELNDFIDPIGKNISISIDNKKIGIKADYKGKFGSEISAGILKVGTFSAQAFFESDDQRYKSSKSEVVEFNISETTKLNVSTLQNTTLRIEANSTKIKAGDSILINGTLKDISGGIGNKKIFLFVNGTKKGEVFTDTSGYFEKTMQPPAESGIYEIKAAFISEASPESNLILITVFEESFLLKIILATAAILVGAGAVYYVKVGKKASLKIEAKSEIAPVKKEIIRPQFLNYREGVISTYIQIVNALAVRNVFKNSNQTHWEFFKYASESVPDLKDKLSKLTELYEEAFYSEHEIKEHQYTEAASKAVEIQGFWGGANA